MHCEDIQRIGLKMEEVVIVVYYDGDMRPHFKGLLFECPNGLKFSKISEEMPLASLGKAVTNAIRGGRSLLDIFYCKLVYVGDGCVVLVRLFYGRHCYINYDLRKKLC